MTTLLTRTPSADVPQQVAPTAAAAPPAPPPAAPAPAAPVRARTAAPAPPTVRRLVLTGTLSKADTAELGTTLEELVATGARTVEVDLSQVDAIDAAVARLLLRTSWHLGDPSRSLVLLHPQRQVRRVLRFYGAGGLVVR